jgi:hypothetical protein
MGSVYLTTLYQLQILFGIKLYERIITFRELERVEEEAVVTYFRVLSWDSCVGLKTTTKIFSQCIRLTEGFFM